ncbi:MAG: hypothetical protein E6Q37_10345 [Crocinitomicaceae bacterium]|nr:MAG: hypothetical protein E6Q37_10345 [Crocinitomicaceae bacterium]
MILFLSDVAGSEVLLILVFVLMFFGSKSIPGLAKTMGRTMRQIKDASQELQDEIKKSGVDIKKDLNINRMIEETVDEIERPLQDQVREMDASMRFQAPTPFHIPESPLPDPVVPATLQEDNPTDVTPEEAPKVTPKTNEEKASNKPS